ncbi:MAG TPA: adenylate/guanylate cyclase domain-containing protein [Nocardioidaceae bacterium]|nr:adenylate/guanylate cyclase domain-containing protein [Nocardioidaceae bacterium]
MTDLPSGRVAFVFTDIEGSTALLTRLGDAAYHEVLDAHDELLRSAFTEYGGVEVKSEGDGLFVAFSDPADAVVACCEAQRRLAAHEFPGGNAVKVRMGVHVGDARPRGRDYIALAVNRAARVMAAGHGGQVLVSQAVADVVDDRVDLSSLGLFVLKDFVRPQPLVQVVLAGQEQPELPEPRAARCRPHGVPLVLTRFVGRDSLLERTSTGVREHPLVSLVGIGGVGKSRIAQRLAHDLVSDFPGGVHYVALAPLTDPALVPAAVATALGVTRDHEDLLIRIQEHVSERRLLLVLDNCEHVLDAAADVADAVARSGVSHVLTTSREPLDLDGEVVVPVDPLDAEESLALFESRVSDAGRAARLPAEAVKQLCRQVDQLPLGIELVAARARSLDADGLARLVADPLTLTGGRRGEPALRRMIERSHELLTPDEAVLFRRLSVFAGGWDVATAERVCRGQQLAGADIAGLMASLVDKSLVIARHGSDGTRYSMLALLRAFAAEQLAASADESDARASHRTWCRELAEAATAAVDGPEFRGWLVSLDTEHANILAAVSSVSASDTDQVREDRLAILAGVLPYWIFRSRPERTALMRRVLLESAGCAPHLRALVEAEMAHEHQGAEGSRAALERAVQLAEGTPGVQALALAYLAEELLDQEEPEPELADELLDRARSLVAQEGSVSAVLAVQAYGANVLLEACWENEEFGRAEAAYQELLATARRVGSVRRQAFALVALSLIAGVYRRTPADAEEWARAAVDLLDEFGERSNACLAHAVLSQAALGRGDEATARHEAEVAFSMAVDSGFPPHQDLAALAMAGLLAAEGASREAVQVLGFMKNPFYDPLVEPLKERLAADVGAELDHLLEKGAATALADLPVAGDVGRRASAA